MNYQVPGSFRLFQAFGIHVFVHWTWFIAAFIIYRLTNGAAAPVAFTLTYLTLFGIVLLHEFGHALACRSVGGMANLIVLWPLGGIAFVQPPQRPGALLWSIAAGPLVNVVLVPVLAALYLSATMLGIDPASPFGHWLAMTFAINLLLLLFNILPIYPLDGGQILQSLLWMFMGRAQSLRIAASIGLTVAVLGGVASLIAVLGGGGNFMWPILALFIGFQAWQGLQQARRLAAMDAWRM